MKQMLVMMMAAAILLGQPILAAVKEPLITNPIFEKRIRQKLKKPEGQLTEADLEKFTELSFAFSDLTDTDLKEVAKLQKLESLHLYYTKITDMGLKDVAKLQKLETLEMTFTKITDAGLKEVVKLQQLKTLFLLKNETHLTIQVTDAGVAELKKALPNCEIKSNSKK